jgi:putative PIN family toxin of toxin-antitoxin system
MKAVFDTNVLVAAFVSEGVCAKLLGRARRKQLNLVISPFILKEFENVLLKKFSASKEQIRTAAKLISEAAQIVSHASMVSGICRDPDDDQILSCALSVKADYLVTGDLDLLELKEFHGIEILTPGAFELLFED